MKLTRTKELLLLPPAVEPVSVAEALAYLQVTHHKDDHFIGSLITAARQLLEEVCASSFLTQTWQYYWDRFWWKMFLPRPPLQNVVPGSFQYVSAFPPAFPTEPVPTNVWETSAEDQCPFVRLQYLQIWPITRGYRDDVTLQVTSGYGASPEDVPRPLRQAILMLVRDWYDVRGNILVDGTIAKLPNAVDQLIAPYRFREPSP